ncbi:MAG TPA: DUF308 domain-containing protein [Actinocrinis sp.]|nr:DUF308 domain-containing protein [Actinocrinis sp.]
MAYFSEDHGGPGGGPWAGGPEGRLGQLARFGWHTALAVGVIAMVLGIIVLAWPDSTLVVVGVLFGLYLLIAGIGQIVMAAGAHVSGGLRALGFVSGALFILLGLMCFRSSFRSVALLGIWVGIGWLFRGTAGAFSAMDAPAVPGRGLAVFFSVIMALAGVVLIVDPIASLATLAVLAGIWLVILGAMEIGHAVVLRRAATH